MTDADDESLTPPEELPKTQAEFFLRAAEKVRSRFPQGPGIYLMQDHAGRVIYVGKAKNLRAGRAAISCRRPPKNAGPLNWSARSTTSTSSRPKVKSTPC